jgi:hypothetical protein
MVRGRHRNETKVLLVDPAQANRGFQRAGTLGGLASPFRAAHHGFTKAILTNRVCTQGIASRSPNMLAAVRDIPTISAPRVLALVAMLNLLWLECAENPAVFCYRVGWVLLAPICQLRRGGNRPPACSN